MSLLERVIVAHKCRSMHHYIAMEALNQIGVDEADAWKAMLLRYNAHLLDGAKAPDAEFKDFRNHVLHVAEGEWGGARDAAMEWYARSVEALRAKDWQTASYNLGVLSHYYADVCQPFHTGQTEEEGAIHRAVEWSIVKSVDSIFAELDESGYPEIEAGDGIGFVADMVLEAAKASHPHYQTFIDHYDVDTGVQDPPSGIDETMFSAVCEMVAYATSGFAALLTRAIEEAGVAAPKTNLTLRGYLASMNIPVRWVTKKLGDVADRKTIEKMYKELQKTGKVIKTLPEDDKLIRKMHARQVLRKPLKELDAQELKPIGSKHVPWEAPEAEEIDETLTEDEVEVEADDVLIEDEAEIEAEAAEIEEVEAYDTEDEIVEASTDEDMIEEIEEDDLEEAPVKLTRAERRAAKRAEKEARKAEKAEAKLARAEAKRAAKAAKAERLENEFNEIEEEFVDDAEFEDAEEELLEDIEFDEEEIEDVAEAFVEDEEDGEAEDYALAEYEDEIDLDEEIDEEEFALDLESADPDNEYQEYEAAYEDTEEFEAELAELANLDLEEDGGEMIEAAMAAEKDFARETASTQHMRKDRLTLESPVVDAPSIGKKTAKRLAKASIRTIVDLLDADPEAVSAELNVRYITPETILDWQDQAMLMMEVPGLRTHDVQVLVGAGIRTGEDLANASAEDVFRAAIDFLSTEEGTRVSRFEDEALDEAEVEEWIDLARQEAA